MRNSIESFSPFFFFLFSLQKGLAQSGGLAVNLICKKNLIIPPSTFSKHTKEHNTGTEQKKKRNLFSTIHLNDFVVVVLSYLKDNAFGKIADNTANFWVLFHTITLTKKTRQQFFMHPNKTNQQSTKVVILPYHVPRLLCFTGLCQSGFMKLVFAFF